MQMYIILSAAFMIGVAFQLKVNDFEKSFKKAAQVFEKIRKGNGEDYNVGVKNFGPIFVIYLIYEDKVNGKYKCYRFLSLFQYKFWVIRHYRKVE